MNSPSHTYEICLALGVLIPLLSFTFLAFYGPRLGKPKASYVALAAIGLSCLLSTFVLIGWNSMDAVEQYEASSSAYRHHWADMGDIPITVGVKLDSLTVIMFFMVTFIAFWIHFFSIGYMEGHSDEVDGQCKYHRFFAYLSLFCFSMLGLVISSSLMFLFIFWELVGLCSYLLIGFYFDKKFASDASIKAFVTNRVGDFGFIVGLALVVLYMGTFDLDEAAVNFSEQYTQSAAVGFDAEQSTGIFKGLELGGGEGKEPWRIGGMMLATIMGIGLFCGAMGKSAQFPLHVWLPDAMAGPTPVSALIHAATMVAAGVYLVARVFRLLTPDAQMFIATIGCITLTITALIAIVQTDIKKVLAYSTLSQLGYMIFGMGVGAWVAALFHLMTHAFFKAMLFLGSGQVIEGCHHEQDMRKMGGLRHKMPKTCWTFFLGVLAIAGFGIPLTPVGLGGFFSKDEILAVAFDRTFNWHHDEAHGHAGAGPLPDVQLASASNSNLIPLTAMAAAGGDGEHHEIATPDKTLIAGRQHMLPTWMYYLPIIIAYVTPFYMMRCWWMTFMGKPRDQHVYDHAHENPKMYIPLIVLAVGTIFCSYFMFRPMLAESAGSQADAAAVVAIDGHAHELNEVPYRIVSKEEAAALGDQAYQRTEGDQTFYAKPVTAMLLHGGPQDAHKTLAWMVGFAWVIGMGLAALLYRNGLETAARIARMPGIALAHRALENKLYFDHVYNFALVKGCQVAGLFWYAIDKYIVDGLVNATAAIFRVVGTITGRQFDMPVKKSDIGIVDAIANGIAGLCLDAGRLIRRPQTGRVRNYVMFAAGAAAIALLVVLNFDWLETRWSAAKAIFLASL